MHRCMLWVPLLSAVALADGVDTAWTRRFNGAGDSTDWPAALATRAGWLYVTGHSFDEDSIEDFATLCYNADGTSRWFRRYDGRGDTSAQARALTVDAAGNCYVTGRVWLDGSRYDWMTAQHDTDGVVRWTTYHDGSLHHDDEPRAIAVCPNGDVVVTGAAFGPALNWDITTIRYSAQGDTLWTAHYDGPASQVDEAVALALDTAGNIYVAGTSYGGSTSQDIVLIKYSPAGETLWTSRWTGTGGFTEDKPTCLLVDQSQNIYVGGYSERPSTGRDFAVIKFSSYGDTLWSRRLDGSAGEDDEVVGIGVDGRGRIYAAGHAWYTGSFADYLVACYSPLGDSLWAFRWDYSGYGNWPTAFAVDEDGNSYVTGYGFDPATQYDYHTISVSPEGRPRWQIRYSGYADDWDQPVAIALDSQRSVYVTGFSMSNAQGFDYLTVRYDQTFGVAEAMNDEVPTPHRGPTIVRGVIYLGAGSRRSTAHRPELLDAAGRRVMSLAPGENDISRLAPGVYFVRSAEPGARGRVDRVIVAR